MRIDTSEPSLTALFNKGQVGLIRTEFMRKDDVIANTNELLEIYKKENADLVAENIRFRKALKEVETAWYAQRTMDVIKAVDKAFEQEGDSK